MPTRQVTIARPDGATVTRTSYLTRDGAVYLVVSVTEYPDVYTTDEVTVVQIRKRTQRHADGTVHTRRVYRTSEGTIYQIAHLVTYPDRYQVDADASDSPVEDTRDVEVARRFQRAHA